MKTYEIKKVTVRPNLINYDVTEVNGTTRTFLGTVWESGAGGWAAVDPSGILIHSIPTRTRALAILRRTITVSYSQIVVERSPRRL